MRKPMPKPTPDCARKERRAQLKREQSEKGKTTRKEREDKKKSVKSEQAPHGQEAGCSPKPALRPRPRPPYRPSLS
jgi:hypothetical protein